MHKRPNGSEAPHHKADCPPGGGECAPQAGARALRLDEVYGQVEEVEGILYSSCVFSDEGGCVQHHEQQVLRLARVRPLTRDAQVSNRNAYGPGCSPRLEWGNVGYGARVCPYSPRLIHTHTRACQTACLHIVHVPRLWECFRAACFKVLNACEPCIALLSSSEVMQPNWF